MCAIFCNFGIVLVALRGMGRLLGAGPGFAQTLIFVFFFRRLRTGGLPCTTGSWPAITRPRGSGPTSPASWRLPRVRPFFFLTFFFFDFIRLTASFAGLQLLPPGSRNWRRTFGPPVLNAPRARRRSRPQPSRRGRLTGSWHGCADSRPTTLLSLKLPSGLGERRWKASRSGWRRWISSA